MRYADPARRMRKAERRELLNRGIRPTRSRHVYCVRLEGFAMPEWAGAERIAGLSMSDRMVWLLPSRARLLARQAEEAGGCATLAEAEFRRCEVCWRPLLGEDAKARRRQVESCGTGRQLPCGTSCYEAQRDRRWRAKNL